MDNPRVATGEAQESGVVKAWTALALRARSGGVPELGFTFRVAALADCVCLAMQRDKRLRTGQAQTTNIRGVGEVQATALGIHLHQTIGKGLSRSE